jgi:hypothetical protein
MNMQSYPLGWNEDRVRQLITAFEVLTEEQQAAEDDAALSFPDSLIREVEHRRDEMHEGSFGVTHDEAWQRIAERNGKRSS